MTTQDYAIPANAGVVSRRLSTRPTLADVACDLLGERLSQASHGLVTPESLALATGIWEFQNDQLQFAGYRVQPLAYAVYERFLTGVPLVLTAEHSFFTHKMGSEYPDHVDVDVSAMAEEIDLAGEFLMEAWCARMAMFFSTPDHEGVTPWGWLAIYLREHLSRVLQAASTLTGHDVAVINEVLDSTGSSSTSTASQAKARIVWRHDEALPLLLIDQAPAPQVYFTYSLEHGFQRFANTESLTTYLGQTAPLAQSHTHLESKSVALLSPCEAWAYALLDHYLASQRALAEQLRGTSIAARTFEEAVDACPMALLIDTAAHRIRTQAIQARLPDWLRQASDVDRVRYGLGLQHLLKAEQASDGKTFMSDIPSAQVYARLRLIEQAALEHPDAPLEDPDDVVVTIHVREDDNLISVAGGGGGITLKDQEIGLVELALLNTGGRPAGWITVSARSGKTLPAWLDHDSVISLVKRIDVGTHYLKLLHRMLSDEQGSERRRLFKTGVSAQLPLLALELKLRHEAGMDAEGVKLVERTFATGASTPRPTVAHLAFKAAPELTPDEVAGMFVLYDSAASKTIVLYVPMSRVPLRQFNGCAQLLEAIAAEPDLMAQVMNGLSDTAQVRYRNDGFQAPHWLRFGMGSDFAPLPAPTMAAISPVAVVGEPLDAIYEGVAEALIVLADRQTVSNWEGAWIFAREVAWLLFNQIMPFLSGTTATAAWLIQLSHSLDEQFNSIDASADQVSLDGSSLIFDVMVAVFSEVFGRAFHAASGPSTVPVTSAVAKPDTLFDTTWSASQAKLTPALRERLRVLAVTPPIDLPAPVPSGPFKGLYQVGHRWLARIDNQYFEVDPGDYEAVVLDPSGNGATGPWIKPGPSAQWQLDLRLRLRGGGPKRRIEQQRELNQQLRAQADQYLHDIEQAYRQLRQTGYEGDEVIKAALAVKDFEGAKTRRRQEQARLENAYTNTLRLHSEYEAIARKVALPDYNKQISTVLAAEVNMCSYFLGIARELLVDHLQTNEAFTTALRTGAALDAEHTTRWFAFLHEHLETAEVAQRWRERLADRLELLQRIPVFGAQTLEQLGTKVASFRTPLEYQILSLYIRLSLLEEPMINDKAARDGLHLATKPLVLGLTTHTQMVRDPELVDAQASELLDGLITTYQAAEDTVHWLKQTLRPEYVTASLDEMIPRLTALREEAESWLGRLIKASDAPSTSKHDRPAPNTSGAHRGNSHRVIRTRNRGTLVAAVSRAVDNTNQEIARVLSPLDGSEVARFSPDLASGDWVEQPVSTGEAESGIGTLRDVDQLVYQADRQLQNANRQLEQAPRLAKVTHIPIELEELLVGAAQDLDNLAERIEHAMTRVNETDVGVAAAGSAELKAKALRDMARRLRKEGRILRISLTKSTLPTTDRVRYLVEEGEVSIRKLGNRVILKGQSKRKDIVQEYVIEERSGATLWYAHFHYNSLDAADDQYVAAHLKTASQRFVGLSTQIAQAMTNTDVVRIYRSRIDRVAAHTLFLSKP